MSTAADIWGTVASANTSSHIDPAGDLAGTGIDDDFWAAFQQGYREGHG
ncbi:hypothetical protein ACGH7X_00445 [Streptomyces sp. BBFR51]